MNRTPTGQVSNLGMECQVIDLGLIEYQKAYELQRGILNKRKRNEILDTLLLLQHPSVITVGRGGCGENILASEKELTAKGIAIYRTDRGGDATFHEPEQLIAYPIFDLRKQVKDIHLYLRKLEEVAIRFLEGYKIKGSRQQGFTGVWTNGYTLIPKRAQAGTGTLTGTGGHKQKIASIGIGVSNWVTYHGLAINVNTDPVKFSVIKPCGIDSHKMTSLSQLLSKRVSIRQAKKRLLQAFKTVFNLEFKTVKAFPLVA